MAGKTQRKDVLPEKADNASEEASLTQERAEFDKGLESPARRLQHYLDHELGAKFGEDVMTGRWSMRRTIGFIFVTCSLFWLIVWMGLRALF